MKTPGNISSQCIIRLSHALSLIFFACTFVIACKQKGSDKLAVVWNDSIPEAVAIPLSLLHNGDEQLTSAVLEVRLQNNNTAVLGDLASTDQGIVFKPVIPFTAGMKYEVVLREKVIGRFHIPDKAHATAPALTAIYPSADTLPANQLKFYFTFSGVMREGEALRHIHLLDDLGDTIPDVFLQLQPELWNADRTELTVWIDPGRIKRELVPNMKMGNPLVKGRRYTVHVSGDWKNIQGMPLQRSVEKKFIVGDRDSLLPDPGKWSILVPKAKTNMVLKISFPEPLDYFLIRDAIIILNEKGATIKGELRVTENETGFDFIPVHSWQPGTYRVRVDAKLEDLAGNNLNRPFDRDISIQTTTKEEDYFERIFIIDP